MLITCQHASRLLSQQQDRPLSWGKRMQLRLHLSLCDSCRTVARQFAAIRLALASWRERD